MSDISVRWRNARAELGTIISQVDTKFEKLEAEEKRMENKRDKSYLKGAEDMKEAMMAIMSLEKDGGMSLKDIDEIFNAPNLKCILEAYSIADIIEKVKQWKEKQEDLKPGDEVEVIKDCHLKLGTKYIILSIDCQPKTEPKIYKIIDLTNFNQTWAYADELKKTGVVHRSLTIYFRGEENNEPSL